MNYNIFTDSPRIHEIFSFKNVFDGRNLNESMTLHFIDLTKFDSEKPASERTPLEKWLHVLRFSEEYAKIKEKVSEIVDDTSEGRDMYTIKQELSDEDAIKLAVNELRKINANPETRAHLEDCDNYVKEKALSIGLAYHEGQKSRQPEVDVTNQKTAEAEQAAVAANQRADQEKARADKIKAEAVSAREKIINNLTSIGLTPEQIANAINV